MGNLEFKSIIFTLVFPLFENFMRAHSKLSKIMLAGIGICGLIMVIEMVLMLNPFTTDLPLIIIVSVLIGILWLILIHSWNKPDTLKLSLLYGVGISSLTMIKLTWFVINIATGGVPYYKAGSMFAMLLSGYLASVFALLLFPTLTTIISHPKTKEKIADIFYIGDYRLRNKEEMKDV